MALSNWDTLAMDENGQPTDGVYVSDLGVEVSIYKNWLYVRDPGAWREKGAFVEPTVMEIREGELRYLDVCVRAVRGPQEGVYAFVSDSEYAPTRLMLGCGVYGYAEQHEPEWVGVQPASVLALRGLVDTVNPGPHDWEVQKLQHWRAEALRRFNQGDVFIERHFGLLHTQATPPGQAEEPLLTRALRSQDL